MKKTGLSRVLPTLVTLTLLVLFFRLGLWQLDRADEKEQLQQQKQRYRASAVMPLQLSSVIATRATWHYRQVQVTGRFDVQHQFLLDNRIYRGRVGFQVLTLLHAQGKYLLVNRGWIPLGPDRNHLPVLQTRSGEVILSGRLTPIGEPGPLLGDAGYGADRWPKIIQQLDLEKIRAQTGSGLIPAVLQLDSKMSDCFVCDWSGQRGGMSADRHRAYAFQWFALAVALMCLYCVLWYRKSVGNAR